jgi:PAS domain S-box-containing protein
MIDLPTTPPASLRDFEQQLREMNEALLVSSVRQHELAEQAQQAEQALHDSEIRYRRLFQTAKDGILILDATAGKILDANAFMSALVGLEPGELLGKELYEIGVFKDIEENKQAFRELQKAGYLRYDHLPIQKLRGETVEVELIASVYLEDERLVAQCIVRDISERVAMENTIKQQAEVLADESRRKDEFLAMLSHELRNPLAPIRSAVHLLKLHERGGENPIQQQAREIIERQVANLTELVSDLMEISRVISGRIRLNLQPVDLNQIVEHAIETITPLVDQRQHKLSIVHCDDGLWAQADPTRMEEVFINLLDNAVKYTKDRGRIEVHCERPQGESYVQVRIRDNGVGIDKKLLPRIFDLFTQADRSLDRAAGGLGIGLSLAGRLVDLHGGTINAHSPPEGSEEGTEFIVRLPLASEPETLQPPAMPESSQNAQGVRVLVVDDNLDLAMVLSTALRLKGYSVQSAHTGPDGLKAVQQWRPDVVLLDIGLPGLDGYEVARCLRSDRALGDASKSMRLIALTGYGRDTDVELALEAGFDAHLVKPYDFDELEKLMMTPLPASYAPNLFAGDRG